METSLTVCFGECSYPFVDRLPSIADTPSYRMDPALALDLPDPESWLKSKAGRDWLGTLQIRNGERVQITVGWAEVVLLPEDPEIDSERLRLLIASLDLLPPPVTPAKTKPPTPVDQDLDPELKDALERFVGYLVSDDVARDARITSAPTRDLEELVEKGLSVMPALNRYLDHADATLGAPLDRSDPYVQLHELGQAVSEGQLELLRRQGR